MQKRSSFEFWRVGVTGSTRQGSNQFEKTCGLIGEHLAKRGTVLISHSGLKSRVRSNGNVVIGADWFYINGVNKILTRAQIQNRVEQVPPFNSSSSHDEAKSSTDSTKGTKQEAEYFFQGKIRPVPGRTRESWRYSFVNSLDALISVGGGRGTQQQLTLAAALDIPILPAPFAGGASAQFWTQHKGEISEKLGLSEDEVGQWEQPIVSDVEIEQRVEGMVSSVLEALPQRAFVIMPYSREFDTLFDLIIEPSISELGHEVRRLDRLDNSGEIIAHIEDGIATADYCVVVLDGLRPNVLYEMGYAHALKKPLVVLLKKDGEKNVEIPFDISTLNRIEYERPNADLLEKLKRATLEISLLLK